MYRIQRPSKGLVEYIADPSSTTELRGLNVPSGPLDGGTVGAGEFCDDLQEGLGLVRHVFAVRVEQALELGDHYVYAHLECLN